MEHLLHQQPPFFARVIAEIRDKTKVEIEIDRFEML
jgi:hypothetical protein